MVPEARVFRADGENLVILACTIFDWSTRATDGQTDRIVMAKTRWKQYLLSRVKIQEIEPWWSWLFKLQNYTHNQTGSVTQQHIMPSPVYNA